MKILNIFGSIVMCCVFLGFYMIFQNPSYPDLHGLDKKAIEINSSVSNINNGGCGWFAFYAAEYLDEQDISYKIIYVFANTNKGKIPNHVALYLNDNCYFDAGGPHSQPYLLLYGDSLAVHTKDDLRGLLSQPGWNPKFNLNDTNVITHLIWR